MTERSTHRGNLAAALAAAGDVAYEWCVASGTVSWFGDVRRLAGLDETVDVETNDAFERLIDPEDLRSRRDALAQRDGEHGAFDCEYRIRTADGSPCWVHDRGRVSFDVAGQAVRVAGVLRVVTRRKAYEAQLYYSANFDELTGYFNRRRLREALQHSLLEARERGLTGLYFSVGVDRLSMINEAYGYHATDAALVAIGHRIVQILGPAAIIGRSCGGCYGAILTDCREAEAPAIAERLLRVFREQPVHTPAGPIHVSVSIGVIAFPALVSSAIDTMNRAETAMQDAERSGRDCFVLYQPSLHKQQSNRLHMARGEQAKAALRSDRLMFAFQPVINVTTGEALLYECLLRVVTLEGTVLTAGDFVTAVEQQGMTRLMDRRVLELAIRELESHPDVRLSVNISAFTATDSTWLCALKWALHSRPDIAQRLVIEITETAAIQDVDLSARFVAQVRELGCSVALDDFGAGYTSFRLLKALPVDIVKIDGSFVRNLAAMPDNQLFVRTLHGLVSGFGLTTIAECVETSEDAAILQAEGIRYLQGYLYGRPMIQRPWMPMRLTLEDLSGQATGKGTRVVVSGS